MSASALAVATNGSLPVMVRAAASKLASAETSAEVLEAHDLASAAYAAAKMAGRFAKAKAAHDDLVGAVHRAQADAAEIEFLAKRRLADEYDAAQKRGEVASPGRSNVGNTDISTVDDLGLTRQTIHEARQIRDAEAADPGIIRNTLDTLLAEGREPTKSAVKAEVLGPVPVRRTMRDHIVVPERAPEIIRSGADLVAALRRVRELMRVTQREFDDLAGWADGYTGKLEQPAMPYGKACTMPSFDEWLATAGVALVMVKIPKAAASVSDLPAVLATEPLRGEIVWRPFEAPVAV